MSTALITRSALCPLRWCMAASGCAHHEAGNGDLHYGRPSSIESFTGDPITVQPFQYDDADDGSSTGPRVEVGSDEDGRVMVALTPAQAAVFADALNAAACGDATETVVIESEPGNDQAGSVAVSHHLERASIGRFDYDLVELTFRDPDENESPTVVLAVNWDVAAYARYVKAAAEEVAP